MCWLPAWIRLDTGEGEERVGVSSYGDWGKRGVGGGAKEKGGKGRKMPEMTSHLFKNGLHRCLSHFE